MNPYIIYKEEDINNNIELISMFNNLMCNDLNICNKCGYDKEGKVLNIANLTFFRFIRKKILQKILIVIFDLLNEYDVDTQIELEKIELLNIFQKGFHQKNIFYEVKEKY